MAFVDYPGVGPYFPQKFPHASPPAFGTGLLIDATGEKIAIMGRIWFKARTGTKAIRNVGFRFGTVVKAGGSAFTVSLQDVSLTTGPPGVPDESQDQTVAIANADAGLTSNAWYLTGNLSADRTVSNGDLVAVVVEFDGAGRLGADSLIINNLSAAGNPVSNNETSLGLKTGGSWAAINGIPNIAFKFSDGTWGSFEGAVAYSAINSHTFNSGTGSADEFALAFKVAQPMKVDCLWMFAQAAASGDFSIVLYEGTNALATVNVDQNTLFATSTTRPFSVPIPVQTLTAGTQYYVALLPTTANNVVGNSFDVADAAIWDALECGQDFNYSTRLNAGSWAAVTATRRFLAGIRQSAISDGAGAGLMVHPGFSGGARG